MIGFNINIGTVEVPTSIRKPLKFTGWDLGIGCASMHTTMRFTHVANSQPAIWVMDANLTCAASSNVSNRFQWYFV